MSLQTCFFYVTLIATYPASVYKTASYYPMESKHLNKIMQ